MYYLEFFAFQNCCITSIPFFFCHEIFPVRVNVQLKSKSCSILVFYFTEQNCCPLPSWILTNRARTRVADPTAEFPKTSRVHGQSAVHRLKGVLHKIDSKKEKQCAKQYSSRHGCSKRKQITIVKTRETKCLRKMSVLIFGPSQTPGCETSNVVAF